MNDLGLMLAWSAVQVSLLLIPAVALVPVRVPTGAFPRPRERGLRP